MGFLSNANSDIRTGVIRDVEVQTSAVKRERERIQKEKKANPGGKAMNRPAWRKKRAKADWARWRAQNATGQKLDAVATDK